MTEYMDPLIDKIVDFLDKFLDRLIDEVLPALELWIWKIVVKVADYVLLALDGLLSWIPMFGAMWHEKVSELREVVSDYWDDVIDEKQAKRSNKRKLRMIEEGLVDAAGNVNIAGRANSLGQAYVDDYLSSLKSGEKDISNEAKTISGIMGSVRHESVDGVSGRSGSFGEEVEEASRSVEGYSGSVGSFGNATDGAKKSLKGLREEIGQSNEQIEREIQIANDVINGKYGNGAKRRDALSEAGYDPDRIQYIVNELLSGNDDVKSSLKSLDASVQNTTDTAEKSESVIERFLPEFPGVKTAVETLSGSVGDFSAVLNFTGENADEFSGRMSDIFTSVTDTDEATKDFTGTLDILSDSIGNATTDASKLSEALGQMQRDLEENRSNSFVSGQNWTGGYLSGIDSLREEVRKRTGAVGTLSVDSLAESIDAHSPSWKTAQLGLMYGAGYLNSLQTFAKPAYLAGEEIGENSVSGLTNPFSTLDSGFGDLYSFSPTITPILDLSDVDSGIAYLQNEFAGNPEFGVRQSWSPDIRTAEALLSLERPDTDINRVIEEMGYLRDDIARFSDEISRMKVYLDTDTLVGEMASPMDSALGQTTSGSIRAGRR